MCMVSEVYLPGVDVYGGSGIPARCGYVWLVRYACQVWICMVGQICLLGVECVLLGMPARCGCVSVWEGQVCLPGIEM